jgi:hypothetical protein
MGEAGERFAQVEKLLVELQSDPEQSRVVSGQ